MFRNVPQNEFIDISTLSEISKLKGELLLWILYPYKSNETLEHKYYQIPQELFVNEFAKTKEILKNATLALPDTPELQDIKKLVLNRDKIICKTRKYYRRIKSHKST